MSAKWRENKAWEDANLVGPLLPVKVFLRIFSSITLAVSLLVFVALYGVSASVPVGLFALAPTYAVYALSLVVVGVVIAGVPSALLWRRGRSVGTRAAAVIVILPLGVLAFYLWHTFLWPHLRYDPLKGEGLRFFADFVKQYQAVTLRRLPGVEMSELEYYAWWPLKLALLVFVANMTVATVRRIEFTFRNIGVLTVHTGIITMALGSVYYSALKLEGDTLLLAGERAHDGTPAPGPPQDRFYDNTRVALYVSQGRGFEQRYLSGVPRYNNYNLSAFAGDSAWERAGLARPWATERSYPLSLDVQPSRFDLVDEDISLRIVGYAAYATSVRDYQRVDVADAPGVSARDQTKPLRIIYLHSDVPDATTGKVTDKAVYAFMLPPTSPAERIAENEAFALEYTLGPNAGMTPERWRDLSEATPPEAEHALVVEVPGHRTVHAVTGGETIDAGDGTRVQVVQLLPTPPFPIITEGYRGSTSSVAVVRITPPTGEAYTRYVYHRFPEINQDVLGAQADGRPIRRDADPAIRISLIEADRLQVYIDEPTPGQARAIVRQRFGAVRVIEPSQIGTDGYLRNVFEKIHLRIGERWDLAVPLDRPSPVPEAEQEKDAVGTHEKSLLAVEVGCDRADGTRFTRVVWLPFVRYLGMMDGAERSVILPDRREVKLSFGRVQHPFPDFVLELADFEMIAYDHRGAPRDYQSVVRVTPVDNANFEQYTHPSTLNYPLRAPFMWNESRNLPRNIVGRIVSGFSPRQFKLSQAGWDAAGWQRTQAQADAGQIPRPFASFTILGVGNNPGIHVIALGGILMALGIPWAFYIKPWLVQREKQRIKAAVAQGMYIAPGHAAPAVPQPQETTA